MFMSFDVLLKRFFVVRTSSFKAIAGLFWQDVLHSDNGYGRFIKEFGKLIETKSKPYKQ